MLEARTQRSKTGQNGAASARTLESVAASARLDQDESDAQNGGKNSTPNLVPQKKIENFQTRMPVIVGEANYKGMLPIDGVVAGQLGGSGGSLAVRQKSATFFASGPELSGEITFRDLVRVNGYIAGTIYSDRGTLIVDDRAQVDANIDVAIAVLNGTINGDIVARQRVEIGPAAKIHGNIWTRSIAIKDGALFDGVCTMIE